MTEEMRVTIWKARFGWCYDYNAVLRRLDGTEVPDTANRSGRQHDGWRLTEKWARRAGRAAAQRYIRYWTPAVPVDTWIESEPPALSQGSDPGQPVEDDDGAVTLHGLSIAVAVALVMLAAVIDSRWPAVVALVVILPAFCQAVKREPDGIEERERVNAALKERA